MADPEKRRWLTVLAAWAVVLGVYALGLHGMPRHVFWSPDEGGKLLQVKTIRFNRGFEYVLPYAGEWLDPELRFYAYRPSNVSENSLYPMRSSDGRFSFHWPMWFPLLSMLPLALFGITGVYLLPLFAGWLTAIFSGLLAAEINPRLEVPAILVVGLASPVYFYSLCFWEHTIAAALAVLAVFLFVRGRGRSAALLTCLPVLIVAAMLRFEMIALIFAIGAAWVACALRRNSGTSVRVVADALRSLRWHRTLPIAFAAGPAIAFVISLSERHRHMLLLHPRRFITLAMLPRALAAILINSSWDYGSSVTADWLAVAVVAVLACAVAPFVRRDQLASMTTVAGLWGFLLFSSVLVVTPQQYRSLHGLLPSAPLMILAPHAILLAWRQPRSPLFVLGAVGVCYLVSGTAAVLVNSVNSSGEVMQGLQWGQRNLLVLYPIFIVMSLAALYGYWESARPRLYKTVVVLLSVLLIMVGFMLQRRGIREARGMRRMLAAWQEALEDRGPIVSDIWWLPASLAEFYAREEVYVVRSKPEVGEWCRVAAASGLEGFTFVSMAPIHNADFPYPELISDDQSSRVVDGLYLSRFRCAHRPPT